MSFSDLGLTPELLRAVADKGYDTPSPIQLQAIPAVLAGRDVLAGAQTGTGKTAGFVLPILQRLAADVAERHRAPRALVLAPTRELAVQVDFWRRESPLLPKLSRGSAGSSPLSFGPISSRMSTSPAKPR